MRAAWPAARSGGFQLDMYVVACIVCICICGVIKIPIASPACYRLRLRGRGRPEGRHSYVNLRTPRETCCTSFTLNVRKYAKKAPGDHVCCINFVIPPLCTLFFHPRMRIILKRSIRMVI